ncbi:MAG: hypothetical protein KDA44_17215 [Planctomycetales bacterium]|nr:hypothetical protein [Planctomycetales bacterium]
MSEAALPIRVDANIVMRDLPSHEREGQIFWRLRVRLCMAHLRSLMAQARLRTSLVVGLSVFFWVGLFALFYGGFEFVVKHVDAPGAPYHAKTMQFIFSLFFLSLQVMLVFSSGIILYSGLYPSHETAFLLTLPTRNERLVDYRFQEALFFSSWGFFLLASPMLMAYGAVVHAPWYYFAYLPVLLAAFAYIPCAVGAIICLVLIDRLPRLRRVILGAAALAIIVIAYRSIWRTLEMTDLEALGRSWFTETYRRFRFMRDEWLPSVWLSHALLDAARRSNNNPKDLPWFESGKYLIVLVSNALFLHIVVGGLGKRMFRSSYCGLHSRPARQPRTTWGKVDRFVSAGLWMLPPTMRVLIVKDLRQFRRDPVQWSQFLIFFGLLLLYFANVDRFRQHRENPDVLTWVNIVSFLNLAVVGLILSTFTTRFIYPLISLEGRRFWILSRLPIDRDTILWGKLLFAAGGSWMSCSVLVLVSDLMLSVSWVIVALHQIVCLLLCIGLSGMAVGLGAIMPNFREQSPSKIAAGFGGTLNLVLSALYILVVVLLTALPCHFYLLAGKSDGQPKLLEPTFMNVWMLLGVGCAVLVTAIVTVIPLRRGLQAFRQLEV